MSIGDGQVVQASINEFGGTVGGQTGDRPDCRCSATIICKNHRIHRQKEGGFSVILCFFMYICRHFAVKVDGILHFNKEDKT